MRIKGEEEGRSAKLTSLIVLFVAASSPLVLLYNIRTYLIATIPVAAPPSSSSSTQPRLSASSPTHKNEILDPPLRPYRQMWR